MKRFALGSVSPASTPQGPPSGGGGVRSWGGDGTGEAAPERGRANAGVIEALAGALSILPSAVEIVLGHGSREKIVVVEGLTHEEAMRRLGSRADS